MRDLGANWPSVPDWNSAVFNGNDIKVRTITSLSQYLISGALDAFATAHGLNGTGSGALSLVSGDPYALRLARDRMLFAGEKTGLLQSGWDEQGFAITEISASLHVFEIEGEGIDELLAEALLIDPRNAGPSANVQFAGQMAVLYRYDSANRLRLHVERGLATYIWNWLEARA
jgi:sarcosine oxidase gamma subunit